MAMFQRHQLQQEGDSYNLILYLDPNLTEFADDLGKKDQAAQEQLESSVKSYVKEKFPNLKVKAAKVMLGSMLVASIPLGAMTAQAAEAQPTQPPAVQAQVTAQGQLAELPDVNATKYEASVKMLQALGIIAGKDDGKYHPLDEITRAEFAKIAVYAAGYGESAELLGTPKTGFGDVNENYWASGYILVAKEKGLMKGTGNNQFNPLGKVSYEEAITVLERLQGYSDEGLVGSWPTNYVIQATQSKIISNTDFKVGTPATRGDVAILLRNILEKPQVTYNTTTKRFQNVEGNKTLIDTVFEKSLKAGYIDTANNQFQISVPETDATGTTTIKNIPVKDAQLIISGAKSLDELLGNEVSFIQVANNSFFILNKQDPTKVLSGKLHAEVNFGQAGAKVQIEGSTTEYSIGDNVIFYRNGQKLTTAPTVTNDQTVSVFLDNENKVRFVNISDFELPMIVSEVVQPTAYLDGAIKGEDKMNTNQLYTIKRDTPVKVVKNGITANLADISKDDVVYIELDTSNNVVSVEAYSNTITGTVTMLKQGEGSYVQIDGVDYTLSSDVFMDSDDVTGVSPEYTVGSKYSFFLDKDGKILKRDSVAGVDPTQVSGMFIKAEVVDKLTENNIVVRYNAITLLTKDGAEKTFLVATNVAQEFDNGDLTIAGTKIANAADEPNAADIVTLTLDNKGNVTSATAINTATYTAVNQEISNIKGNEITLKTGATTSTYRLADNVVIYDKVNKKVLTRDALKAGYEVSYKVGQNGIYIEQVQVTGGNEAVGAANAVIGLYKGAYTESVAAGEYNYFAKVQVGPETKNIPVTKTIYEGLENTTVNSLVTVQDATGNDGKYDQVNPGTAITTTSDFTVDTRTNTFVQDASKYVVDPDTTIYLISTNATGKTQVTQSNFSAISSIKGVAGATVTVVPKVEADGTTPLTLGDFTRVSSVVIDQTTIPTS